MLLGNLLLQVPDQSTLDQLSALQGDEGEVGSVINPFPISDIDDCRRSGREYNILFIGVGRGEVLPYASYYLTGFLHEKPLADLRAKCAALAFAESKES